MPSTLAGAPIYRERAPTGLYAADTLLTTSNLFVPDRFDALDHFDPDRLRTFIMPVEEALRRLRHISNAVRAARRGFFLILRGEPGCGKSTFLHTLGLFLENTQTVSIAGGQPIAGFLAALGPTKADLRVVVIEGREAVGGLHDEGLGTTLQSINAFLRSPEGKQTLVVWPCNTEDLEGELVSRARTIGGDALLGVGQPVFSFRGPPFERYPEIGRKTVATLNEGASLLDLGVSEAEVLELANAAGTIGSFLGSLREALLANTATVTSLLAGDHCKLWIVVVAGGRAEGDVAALTRGNLRTADLERLMAETRANIVRMLRSYSEKVGILSAVMDVKILYLPVLAALATVRTFACPELKRLLEEEGVPTRRAKTDNQRILKTDVGRAFRNERTGPVGTPGKPGSRTMASFEKLLRIARTYDSLLNRSVGRALEESGLVSHAETEEDFGTGLERRTDLSCESDDTTVRLEMMWRASTSRAGIAAYTLRKIYNYGQAIGLLPLPGPQPSVEKPSFEWRRTTPAQTERSEWARYTTDEDADFESMVDHKVALFRAGTSPLDRHRRLSSWLNQLRRQPALQSKRGSRGELQSVESLLETARLQARYGDRGAAEEAMDHCERMMTGLLRKLRTSEREPPPH